MSPPSLTPHSRIMGRCKHRTPGDEAEGAMIYAANGVTDALRRLRRFLVLLVVVDFGELRVDDVVFLRSASIGRCAGGGIA